MQKQVQPQSQKNKLSVLSIVLLVIGSCIGSGIFYKNQGILEGNQGSILLSIICWLIVGVSSIFVAFSLVEICSIKYDRPALGLLGWVKVFNNRFMYRCSKYFISYCYWPILIYSLSIYFIQSICLGLNWNISWYVVVILALVVDTWFIFMTGIFTKIANISSWIITCFKFIPLIFAIIIGYIYVGIEGNIYTGGQGTPQGWLPSSSSNSTPLFNDLNIGFGMISTFPAIMFAMNGFQYATSLQHEMKNPKKLTLSMNIGICIVLVIYIALSVSLMICSDGSIKDLQGWLDYRGLHWVYVIIQLLIAVGILSVINGTSASATRMYEDLIIHNELICSHKFNKKRSNISKPVNGAIYFYILTLIFIVVCVLIGAFFVNETGIQFFSWNKHGLSSVTKLNDTTGGIFAFVDVLTSSLSLLFFLVTIFPIYGCLRNRTTKKIKTVESKLFVVSAIISLVLISVATLSYVVSSFSNPFIIGNYISNNKYANISEGTKLLITSLLTLLMIFIYVGASVIPAVVESNRRYMKYLKERNKKKT